MSQPTSLSQVRDRLCVLADQVQFDNKRVPQVHEAANALGKVVASCKVYLEFCALGTTKPDGDWKRFIGADK